MRYENLEVWKKSSRLSVNIYKYFKKFKDFSFKDQITRSCLSIASNIAEDMEKDSDKDKIRFLNIRRFYCRTYNPNLYRDRNKLY